MIRIRTENKNTREEWDAIYGNPELTRRWTVWRDPVLVAQVNKFIPAWATILHVGCGAGICAEQFQEIRKDLKWTGCDLSEKAIEYLRKESPVPWQETFTANLELPNFGGYVETFCGNFDVVLCVEVLEHMENPKAAIAHLARLAAQRLIVSVPLDNATDSKWHLWSFSFESFAKLLEPFHPISIELVRNGTILLGVCEPRKS